VFFFFISDLSAVTQVVVDNQNSIYEGG